MMSNNNNNEQVEETLDIESLRVSDDSITMEYIQNLLKKRVMLEKELEQHQKFLSEGGGKVFGMSGSFVDADGFPSPHIEVIIEVKKARNRISCIQNDYKLLMKLIEESMYILHSKSKSSPKTTSDNNNNTPLTFNTSTNKNTTTTKKEEISLNESEKDYLAFVYIDLVSEGSPSDKAGLKKGDEIYQFGSIGPFRQLDTSVNHLFTMSNLVKNSENKPIQIHLIRNSQRQIVYLTPRKWSGQGLIGCLMKLIITPS
ncbi:26S proteasome non-ATPase regulatory subunit 9 [Tieghemostelium lacteum]|uniref:26S proteasome non-ATPase regulatory subunit 9 n=1 Tax=Tieghemostelium lacteum TaxID=361077 RepID=A0A151ZIH9_TIELA|nr:26S proteasome non-ATPase regulatory subunit 9 [Tieghemostelium lacteum]|eukprot:KYQ93717.1 26S proteasome non-ATPase regulatory subunit 9 [Tieghemostelium lacteum]